MIANASADGHVESYLRQAVAGDSRGGVRMALDLLDNGVPSDEVIVGLLGAAQQEVGERWARNTWSVADEHLVSNVTQKALDALASSLDWPVDGGHVVVACAEGDWHSLPAQMFAEMLRSRRFAVSFLGASTPVEAVASLLSRQRPLALAVSCNMPLFYAGLARMVEAAHRYGTPVLAGGRALGTGPERAVHLGADAWAGDIAAAVPILEHWSAEQPALRDQPSPLEPGLLELDDRADEIATGALASLIATFAPLALADEREQSRLKEDLALLTRFIAAARLVDDRAVLTDMVDWLRQVQTSRGSSVGTVPAALRVLAPLIRPVDELAADLALAVG